MTQSNWEGGKIASADQQRNIVSDFKDSVPSFDKGRWNKILLIGLAILVGLWFLLPASNHPLSPRPAKSNYQPQQSQKSLTPFVAKSHDEAGAEARKEAAKDVPGQPRSPLVVDQADLFSEKDEVKLTRKAEAVSDKYELSVVIVTADSSRLSEDTRDKSDQIWARDYADDFFDYHQYGENGVLLLISLDPRQVWISTTGRTISLFTDARIEHLLDEIFKYANLSKGDYCMAPYIFLDQVELNLKKGWDASGTAGSTKLLTKKYLTGIELKRALLISAAIALVFYVRTRIRYASQTVPDIYDVKTRSQINEMLKQDQYVRTDTDVRRVSTSSSSSGGGGGSGGGGSSSSHSGSSGSSHGGGGRGF
ncbi:MAG: TPM domain-containing protein [Saccharofermentanales bacterium]|jgi:uncharacterized protein